MKTKPITFVFILVLTLASSGVLAADHYPNPIGKYVTDSAGVFTPEQITALNNHCAYIERDTGVEIAVITVPSTWGEDVMMFAAKTGDINGVGMAETDDGVVILLSLDHEPGYAIATGRGAESTLTDAYAHRFAKEAEPFLNRGQYFEGFESTLSNIDILFSNSRTVTLAPDIQTVKSDLVLPGLSCILSLVGAARIWRGGQKCH